jgi:peptidoglycan/LPS O-acetylase OafA/YrhL
MFLSHIHNFRAVAILGIVSAHALQAFNWGEYRTFFKIANFIANQSSIWFVFIAGFLFQHLSGKFTASKYYAAKLKNVIVPYLIISIPGLYYYIALDKQDIIWPEFYDKPIIEQLLLFILTGKHLSAFWFVPMITVFYLLAPLFIAIDRSRYGYWIMLPTFLASAMLGRDNMLFWVEWAAPYSVFSKALFMLPVYLFGMYFSRHHDNLMEVVKKLWPLLTILAIALIAGLHMDVAAGKWMHFLFKLTSAVLILYWLRATDAFIGKKLYYLADVSFGVFFIHGYFLGTAKLAFWKVYGRGILPEGNPLLYFGYLALIILACLMAIWVVKYLLKGHSRLLIGC